jgi:hypothetical protein
MGSDVGRTCSIHGKRRNSRRDFGKKARRKRKLGILRRRLKDNIKKDFKKLERDM